MDSVLAPRLLTGSEKKVEKKRKQKEKKNKKHKTKQKRKLGVEARKITGSQTEEDLECQSKHL